MSERDPLNVGPDALRARVAEAETRARESRDRHAAHVAALIRERDDVHRRATVAEQELVDVSATSRALLRKWRDRADAAEARMSTLVEALTRITARCLEDDLSGRSAASAAGARLNDVYGLAKAVLASPDLAPVVAAHQARERVDRKHQPCADADCILCRTTVEFRQSSPAGEARLIAAVAALRAARQGEQP